MKAMHYAMGISAALALLLGCGARKTSGNTQYYGANYYTAPPNYAYPGYGGPAAQAPGMAAPTPFPYSYGQPAQPPPPSPATPPPVVYAPPPPPPSFARVSLLGMLIGPGKIDRTQWDGPGQTVDEDAWMLLASALTKSNAYAAALSVMAGPAMQALEKPDVGGSATLVTADGERAGFSLVKKQDTFTPQWIGADWDGVPLDGSARIRVVAIDRDLMEDDPMGTFEISAGDILKAIQSAHVYSVPVHLQTNKQILFVQISAMAQ